MFSAPTNLAIMLGEVSGGLACRDFDKPAPYAAFRMLFPKLAHSIPTVETASGKRHVYFRIQTSAGAQFGDKGAIFIGDAEGELRLRNCYCIAPPSRINGKDYRWVIEGDFPELDPRDYYLDQAFADLPQVETRERVSYFIDQLRLASASRDNPIGEAGRHVDDLEFLWQLATLERSGPLSEALTADALAAAKSEKPEKRVAYLRKAVIIRCKANDLDFHKLLARTPLPESLPRSFPHQKTPNRTEPPETVKHKRAQEDSRGAGNSGGARDASHEGEGVGSANAKMRGAPEKRLPYAGPILKLGELTPELESAIEATLPSGTGRRERLLFDLARRFKAIPECATLEIWAFQELIREWHRRALLIIGTKPFSETWSDFIRAWKRVRKPHGAVMNEALETARAMPIPPCVKHHDEPMILDLARLCSVLQTHWKGEPFPLAVRPLAKLFEVSDATAWRTIGTLRDEDILQEVSKGQMKTRRASEYFYLGD
jgi:hypothetical protein